MRRSSKVTARKPGSLTSGDIDAVRLVGPTAPATKRGRSGVATTATASPGELRPGPVQLISEVAASGSRPARRGRGEGVGLDDVGAGLEIGDVNVADDVRLRQDQKVVVAAHVAGPAAEPLAAIARIRRTDASGSSSPSPRRGQECAPWRGRGCGLRCRSSSRFILDALSRCRRWSSSQRSMLHRSLGRQGCSCWLPVSHKGLWSVRGRLADQPA